jgi:hypothetical protein
MMVILQCAPLASWRALAVLSLQKVQMAGRESGESGPFRDDRSEEQPAKLAPINLRFSRAAEAFNPAFNAASAYRLRLRRGLYRRGAWCWLDCAQATPR